MKAVIGVLAAASVLAACGPSTPSKEKLQVGAIISLTGSYGALGSERLQGALLAAEQINAAGGVLGKDLEIVSRDDGTEPTRAAELATEFVNTLKVPAIIGAAASGSTIAMSAVTIPAQVVSISGSSTSPAISALADDGYVNRTCPSDALQGKLIAQRAKAKGFTKMAVIYSKSAYGEGMAGAFEAAFVALGGTVTAKVEAPPGQASYSQLLTDVYAGNPEAILLPAYTVDGVQIIKDYVSGFSAKGTFWFFPDALAEQAFVTAVGESSFTFSHEGTGPAAPKGAAYEAFANAYKAKYGKTPETTSFSANFYDATYLLALAITAGGAAEGPAIRDNLRKVSEGGTAYAAADYAAAVTSLQAQGNVNYEGASGNVDLDEKGEPIAPYDVWKVQGGQITVIESSVSP